MTDVSTQASTPASRVERERHFHDHRYADETRRRTAKYYDSADASQAAYRGAIDAALAAAGPTVRVLEYGCGTGSAAFELAGRGAEVIGIDISAVAVEQANASARARSLGGVRFEVMNAEALDLAPESFDVVCGSGILHHLDLDIALAEIARVLKPGGRAVFVEPLGHNPLVNVYRRLTPKMRTVDEHPLVVSDLAIARRHFGHTSATPFHLLSLAGALVRRLPGGRAMLPFLDRADRALFDRVPWSGRLAWIAVIELSVPVRAGGGGRRLTRTTSRSPKARSRDRSSPTSGHGVARSCPGCRAARRHRFPLPCRGPRGAGRRWPAARLMTERSRRPGSRRG